MIKIFIAKTVYNACKCQVIIRFRPALFYKGFKKTMGYSDLEISQKRNALEHVLIPDNQQQHEQRLQNVGFAEVYQCFRGFNFVSYLAIKSEPIKSAANESVTIKS